MVLAVHDGKEWIHSWRVYSDQKKTSDEYYVTFRLLFESSGLSFDSIKTAVVSSVVPNLTLSVQKNIMRIFSIEPVVINYTVNSGLNKDTIPSELGSDLLCNMAYAHHIHPNKDVMVVDFGTALTLSTVGSNGDVLGVAIAPGLLTAVNSLFGSTAQLPQVELKIPTTALGVNSEQSIRAGIMFGYAGLVSSMIKRTERELGRPLFVIATGGLSATTSTLIPEVDELDKMHTLNGIKLVSEMN